MTSRENNSKLLLKKIIEENSFPSKLQSFHSLELFSRRYQSAGDSRNSAKQQKKPSDISNRFQEQQQNQCTFNNNHHQVMNGFLNNDFKVQKVQSFQEELKLQSRVLKEVDCLYIQSKVQIRQDQNDRQVSVMELPLECLESKMHMHKLKVHSSIDGMETSKQSNSSHNNTFNTIKQKQKEKSLPISDLILTDNKYMKKSNGLNQHEKFSISQEIEYLTLQYFDNLKLIKQQTIQQIQCIQKQLSMVQKDELIEKMNERIFEVETDIQNIKISKCRGISSQSRDTHSKARSKTPEIRRLKSQKNVQTPSKVLVSPHHYREEQMLEKRLMNEKQKNIKQRQKSVKVTQKLSQVKSDYKQLQQKLDYYQNTIVSPPMSPKCAVRSPRLQKEKSPLSNTQNKATLLMSPKSQLKVQTNCRTKYFGFLQKQKQKYFLTMKQHVRVIEEEIQTFKAYQTSRCQQLKQEIELLKNEIRYVDVKSVEKFFFTSPYKGTLTKAMNKQVSKEKSTKKSAFQYNYSQKLISTYSSNSLHNNAIPPLSPRTPQLHSRSPQLYSRSPQYQHSTTSITPRSIRGKDTPTNLLSDRSTNHSQTKIRKSKVSSPENIINFQELQRKMCKGKQNNNGTRHANGKIKPGSKHKILVQHDGNAMGSKGGRRLLKNFVKFGDGDMRTEPSDDYCINSENQFRW